MVYQNRAPMDFDDVEDTEPDQVLTLTASELDGGEIILEYVKFQNVSNLVIFVPENVEKGEVTEMSSLSFFGCPYHKTDMAALKKVG